jgi:hypothetical protein
MRGDVVPAAPPLHAHSRNSPPVKCAQASYAPFAWLGAGAPSLFRTLAPWGRIHAKAPALKERCLNSDAETHPLALATIAIAAITVSARPGSQVPPPPSTPPASAPQSMQGAAAPAATGTGLVMGRVVDGSSGKPIPGAMVGLTVQSDAPGRRRWRGRTADPGLSAAGCHHQEVMACSCSALCPKARSCL